MSALETADINSDDEIVLQNISNCINDKMAILNVKLPELAKDADVDYFTLRKIINQEIGYMPNLRIIIKLAHYLGIKVGDLLTYHDLPQYIPIIDKCNVSDFLIEYKLIPNHKNKIFSEKYIHEKAFAIKELSTNLISPAEIIYICYPNQNKTIVQGQVYLIKIENNDHSPLLFSRVITAFRDSMEISVENKTVIVSRDNIIATVISMQMSESLI